MKRVLFLSILATTLLSGCSWEEEKLKAENQKQRTQLAELQDKYAALSQLFEQKYYEKQAEQYDKNQQAAIASGCDVIIPVCPESLTNPGHKAQAEGAGGGATRIFWLIFTVKTAILALFASVAWTVGHLLWIRRNKPEQTALAAARKLVAEAEELAAAAKQQASQAENQAQAARETAEAERQQAEQQAKKNQQLAQEGRRLEAEIKQKREEIVQLETEAATRLAAQDALGAFNL